MGLIIKPMKHKLKRATVATLVTTTIVMIISYLVFPESGYLNNIGFITGFGGSQFVINYFYDLYGFDD